MIFKKTRMKVRAKTAELKLYLAKRRLENELQQVVELTNSHKETGLPSGHAYYRLLNDRAQTAIETYQERAKKLNLKAPDAQEIKSNVPDLRTLEDLATSKDEGVKKHVPLIVVGIGMLSLGVSTLIAVSYDWFWLLTHWFRMHFGA